MTSYNIYKNDGLGGAVDYGTIIANTASLSYAAGALVASKDTTWAIRATDGTLIEQNVNARVRIITDASAHDISAQPSAPQALTGRATVGGTAVITWTYPPNSPGGVPTNFHVYRGTPGVSYGSPIGTVAFHAGQPIYTFSDTGLSDEVAYQYAVRSYNATAEETNTIVITITGEVNGPTHVDSLAGSVTT